MHNLFDTTPGWTARVAERNAALLAQQPMRRRGVRTPEVIFAKHFDNSRLVKAADPVRVRQMRIFSAAVRVLFSLVMIYGLQHFSAIEGSYRVESEKQTRDQLREENRQLRLTEAQLSQPGRIDGHGPPVGTCRAAARPGGPRDFSPETSVPVMAQVTPPAPLRTAVNCEGDYRAFAHAGTLRANRNRNTTPRAMPLKLARFWLVCLFFLVWAVAIAARLFWLQVSATANTLSAPRSSSNAPLR